MKEHYDRLFIKQGSTLEEIKTAYRKLAKKFHPDVNQNNDYIEEFKMILEAYEKLVLHFEPNEHIASQITKEDTIEDYISYSDFSNDIEVGCLKYENIQTKFAKEISIHYNKTVADGVYLIIKMRIKNTGKNGQLLSYSDYKLYYLNKNWYG